MTSRYFYRFSAILAAMKSSALIFIFLFICQSDLFSADTKAADYSTVEFLERVRHPAGRESWAAMSGTATHIRRGSEALEAPIYLGIKFTSERTLAQVLINNNEAYFVGQSYASGSDAASVIPANKAGYAKSVLADFGLRPQDLTMTFLFWDLRREFAREDIKGRECRVFLLESKDKTEFVKVYISSQYLFPLKAEWFKSSDSALKTPYRTLEVDSFKKENDFWIVSSLLIYGPGWKTRVEFDKTNAGFKTDKMPSDIFKELK